jgi:hypothetical protein
MQAVRLPAIELTWLILAWHRWGDIIDMVEWVRSLGHYCTYWPPARNVLSNDEAHSTLMSGIRKDSLPRPHRHLDAVLRGS